MSVCGAPRRDRLHLRHRAVLVILSLDAQNRTADRRQILLDIPRRETPDPARYRSIPKTSRRRAHDIAPASCGRSVVSYVTLACSMLAMVKSSTNTCGASRINPRTASGYLPAKIIEIEPPSLCPSKNRPVDVQLVEQFRQHHFAFVMHELDAPLFHEPVGVAVSVSRIDQHAASGALSPDAGENPSTTRSSPALRAASQSSAGLVARARSTASPAACLRLTLRLAAICVCAQPCCLSCCCRSFSRLHQQDIAAACRSPSSATRSRTRCSADICTAPAAPSQTPAIRCRIHRLQRSRLSTP